MPVTLELAAKAQSPWALPDPLTSPNGEPHPAIVSLIDAFFIAMLEEWDADPLVSSRDLRDRSIQRILEDRELMDQLNQI